MTMNYQHESSHIADYQLYTLPGVPFTLRGPQWPLHASTPAISFLGAAQTFGTFCNHPYANLLGEMCSARVLNFGRGGAGPGFFLGQQAVLDLVNTTACCVVQVMSARSGAENSWMTSPQGLASVIITRGRLEGQQMLGHAAFPALAAEMPRAGFHALVEQTRAAFLDRMVELAGRIRVPKILLHVGRNPPLPDPGPEDDWTPDMLIGGHPHMVTAAMLDRLAPHFDASLAVHGPEGADAPMINRFTGETATIQRPGGKALRTHNAYISPALHARAALELYSLVSRHLRPGRR